MKSLDHFPLFADSTDMFIPIIIVVIILVIVAVGVIILMGRLKKGGGKSEQGNSAVFKEATKRLNQNPRDPDALTALGNYYYQQNDWENAYKTYTTLTEVGGSKNEFEVYSRYGLCAQALGMTDNAYKGLTVARSLNQSDFEVNYNLGAIEFQRKNYEKAIQLLQLARSANSEDVATLRCLGHAFFKLNRHKEAMTFIRKAMELSPDDKESLYVLGECYFEANQTEQALKIFAHLRPDPVMGASASLFSGTINIGQHNYEKAIADFEIGLKHENVKPDTLLELRYKLATSYLHQNEIGKALPILKLIQSDSPDYKDVPELISRFQELNANKNLQIFLMASSADFVALCRKIVMSYYPKGRVKIVNISVTRNDWADITADVDTPKWSDTVMFRFIRTQGSVGELIVRDFHSHLKEIKAGKGICITIGTFSDEAKHFTEARLIDLIEKDQFTGILNSVDAHSMNTPPHKSPKK
jgi:tetratricopeptide (TPR) repeat protein